MHTPLALALALAACRPMATRPVSRPSDTPTPALAAAPRAPAPLAPAPVAPPPASTEVPVELAAGDGHTCARLASGRVVCWGGFNVANDELPVAVPWLGARGTPTFVDELTGAARLFAGGAQGCALRTDGALACWGNRRNAFFSEPRRDSEHGPLRLTLLAGATHLALAWFTACGLMPDGTVRCIGSRRSGRALVAGLPDAGPPAWTIPGLANVTAIAAGASHFCALRASGTVVCWGAYATPAVPGPASGPELDAAPTEIAGLANVAGVTAGLDHTCAWLRDGTARCFGNNRSGQLGDGTITASAAPRAVVGLADVVELAAGSEFTCARRRDGSVACWGAIARVEAGGGAMTTRAVPEAVPGLAGVVQLVSGRDHSCALDASHAVWCWGERVARPADAAAGPSVLPFAQPVAAVAGQDGNLCALGRDGAVQCTGAALRGSGRNTPPDEAAVPATVSGLAGVVSLASSGGHACAALGDGSASCWGAHFSGQVGPLAGFDDVPAPRPVRDERGPLAGVAEVATGAMTSCARMRDGRVVCWGQPLETRFARRSLRNYALRPVPGVTDARALALAWFHACVLRASARVSCWGDNGDGQLGDGTRAAREGAAEVSGLADVTHVSAGFAHTCAVHDGGAVSCWGRNALGELGDGTTRSSARPVRVAGLADVASVTAGRDHTCAVRRDGAVLCWGASAYFPQPRASHDGWRTPAVIPALAGARALLLGSVSGTALMSDGRVACWGACDTRAARRGVSPPPRDTFTARPVRIVMP